MTVFPLKTGPFLHSQPISLEKSDRLLILGQTQSPKPIQITMFQISINYICNNLNKMTIKVRQCSNYLHFIVLVALIICGMSQDVQNNTSTNSTAVMVYPSWLGASSTEYNQFLADQYNYFITPKGNRIWSCAMSMAWNELKRGFLNGSNATFEHTSQLQQKIVDNFNAERFTKSQLSQNSYYVTSGFGKQTVEKINLQIRQKFPQRTFPPLDYNLTEADFISFAYLYKNFKYRNPFNDLANLNFNGKVVAGFQAFNSKQKNQVYYKYYNNSNNFMVGIETDNENDQILMWKTNNTGVNGAKFEKILSMIEYLNALPSTRINKIDKFQMPNINLDYDRDYDDLARLKFTNPGYKDYAISSANQKLKVVVTKNGVVVENQGVIVVLRTSIFGSKSFILNSDFWLIMKEKNKKPYLVMLIKDPAEEVK